MKHEQGTSPILKEDQNGSLNYSGYSSASIVGNSRAYLADCMVMLKQTPDKYYDLSVVDPPYGIGEDWKKRSHKTRKRYNTGYNNKSIPDKEYFYELRRVSRNQIIWGYNYFVQHLGPTNNLIIWDKKVSRNNKFKYSMCEIAFSSFNIPCDIVSVEWDGARMGKETGTIKIHPHQRPIELHRILLSRYAKPGDKILDTHLGSGSSRIAAYDMGFDFTGYEIDPDYFAAQEKRFQQFKAQTKLFV